MRIEVKRFLFDDKYTIGRVYIDGIFFCHSLEDRDRGLDSSMTVEEILKIKVKTQTAIPTGTYTVVNTFSPRFKKYLPILLRVKGFAGIRIHPGNKAEHTDGCILLGVWDEKTPNKISYSVRTFNTLHESLVKREKKEKITITISKEVVSV